MTDPLDLEAIASRPAQRINAIGINNPQCVDRYVLLTETERDALVKLARLALPVQQSRTENAAFMTALKDGLEDGEVLPSLPTKIDTVAREIAATLNRASLENESNTPDWILATYLLKCLEAFDGAVRQRERWYGRSPNDGPASLAAPASSTEQAE